MLGLAAAPFCTAVCAMAVLPAVLSREDPRLRSNILTMAEFLLGRLMAYAGVGLLFGWLGASAEGAVSHWASVIAYGLLGVALLLYAASETGAGNTFCRRVRRWGGARRTPLLLGLLTGANLCPPFVAAIAEAARAGGAMRGLASFMGFFLATSVATLPLVFSNLASAVRSLGRVACGVAGLILLCLAVRSAALEAQPVYVSEVHPDAAWLQQILPSASSFTAEEQPVRHFVGVADGRKVGVVAFSDDLAPEVEGFGGHVPVAVALDMEGRIQSVRILAHHRETPGFMRMVDTTDFLKQFREKSASDPIETGRDIDGVTGATYTARAVTEAARLTARQVMDKVLSLHVAAAVEPGWQGWAKPAYLVIFLLLIAAALAEMRRVKWLRFLILGAAFFYLGIRLKAFFTVKQVFDIATLATPSLRTHALWYILAIAALGSAPFMGRLYCAYLCPFGALSELLGRVFRSPLKISAGWDRKLRRIKYGVLIALAVVYAAAPRSGLLHVEPFVDLFTFSFLAEKGEMILRLAWLLFLGVASLLVFRFFCRYLCPAGAAMAFLARHRIFGRKRPDGCVECGECLVSCPKKGGMP